MNKNERIFHWIMLSTFALTGTALGLFLISTIQHIQQLWK